MDQSMYFNIGIKLSCLDDRITSLYTSSGKSVSKQTFQLILRDEDRDHEPQRA
jgi:hypothetical protein